MRCTQTKNHSENRKSPKRVTFLLVEKIKHLTSIAVLTVHAKTSLLYTFQQSMKVDRNTNLFTHLQVIPQPSTKNTANFPLQTYEKNQWTFLLFNTGVDFSLRSNFANSGYFAKASVPVHIYDSLKKLAFSGSCLLIQSYIGDNFSAVAS